MKPVQITVSCATSAEAKEIMKEVLRLRLAASAQTWPIESSYHWRGQVVNAREHVLLLKTVDIHFDAICAVIQSMHSYDVPSTMMTPIIGCGDYYLEWIMESVSGTLVA